MSCKNCKDPEGYNSATAGQIVEAWTEAAKAKKAKVTRAEKRLSTCATCEHNHRATGVLGVLLRAMPEKLKERHPDFHDRQCQLCHCPLTAKAYVEVGEDGQGGCPLKLWDKKPEQDAATEVE